MTRAISYDRVSNPEQARGDGLRRQLELAQAYCKEKSVVLDEGFCLRDVGVSGFRGKNAKHGALALILEAARGGRLSKGTWLIIENLDRLSRLPLDEALMQFRDLLIAGVEIHCLMPRMVFNAPSLKNLGQLLPALFSMSTANEESQKKSDRLKAVWSERRRRMPEGRVTNLCPKWLRPAEDGKHFKVIPEAAATVRLIYRLSRDGYGAAQIAKRLNRDKVAPIGRGDHWCRAYVSRILNSRAVIGEYQPCVMSENRRPMPEGDPIPGYFPALMSEKEWHAARRASTLRKKGGGPPSKQVPSLFNGLIYDARDGQRIITRAPSRPGQKRRLVSSGAVYGVHGSSWISFPYEWFETHFLSLLTAKEVPNLLMQESGEKESEIAAVTAELLDEDNLIQELKKTLRKRGNRKSVAEALADADERREALSEKLERLRGEQATSGSEVLGETRSLFMILQQCPPEQLCDLRSRLKARLQWLVESIWVLIEGDQKQRVAHAQVFFRNGQVLCFDAHHPPRRGVCIEDGPNGQRRASATQFPLDIHGWVLAAAEVPPGCDLRLLRERRQRPDLGGTNWTQPMKARQLRIVPGILVTREPQTHAKRRRPTAG